MGRKSSTRISIAILNYNRESFLERSIRSATEQVLGSFSSEVLVVDDGSTDDSERVLEKFPQVRFISLARNRGVGYASSVALSEATGDYFMRVDSDDFLGQDAVRLLASILNADPSVAYAHGDIRRINEETGLKDTILLDARSRLFQFGAGVLYRREILMRIGGYDETLRNCEDLDLFLRLEKSGFVGRRLAVPLYRYHLHASNTSKSPVRQYLWDQVFRKNGLEPIVAG